jgi:hypothetical protein
MGPRSRRIALLSLSLIGCTGVLDSNGAPPALAPDTSDPPHAAETTLAVPVGAATTAST